MGGLSRQSLILFKIFTVICHDVIALKDNTALKQKPAFAGFSCYEEYRLEFVTHAQHDHLRCVVMAIAAKAYDVPDPIDGDIIGGIIVFIILNFIIQAQRHFLGGLILSI